MIRYSILLFILLFISCGQEKKSLKNEEKVIINKKENISNLITTWYEVELRKNSYILNDCGYEGRRLKIKKDSIHEHGIMEDSDFSIYKILKNQDNIFLYINEKDFYSISWVDKLKRIIRVNSKFYGNSNRYYVSQENLKNIKKVQENGDDCIEDISFERDISINGDWKINCESIGALKIREKEVFIEVNSNQIYIDATLEKKNDSIYNIYLNKPKDLGRGGVNLDWGYFSKDSIISRINCNKKSEFIIFNWLGFYNV
ncbi:hypothetical protein [Tenacibaculum ovolyticum]|uniref:hypothetical protein n=1 Tax=Tenacibaculum ovolyticum TaxID=104270 RepID=UPI000408960F|nr:hypothetical protein [Tenacibaculum ovolyticum]